MRDSCGGNPSAPPFPGLDRVALSQRRVSPPPPGLQGRRGLASPSPHGKTLCGLSALLLQRGGQLLPMRSKAAARQAGPGRGGHGSLASPGPGDGRSWAPACPTKTTRSCGGHGGWQGEAARGEELVGGRRGSREERVSGWRTLEGQEVPSSRSPIVSCFPRRSLVQFPGFWQLSWGWREVGSPPQLSVGRSPLRLVCVILLVPPQTLGPPPTLRPPHGAQDLGTEGHSSRFLPLGNSFRGGFGGQILENAEIIQSFNKHFQSTSREPRVLLVLGTNW